jgi:hypothetical protein
MKLIGKTRHGATVHKTYEEARTPYQRLLEAGTLTEQERTKLAATYSGINPVTLLKQINSNLEQLWRLSEVQPVPGNRNYKSTKGVLVTL